MTSLFQKCINVVRVDDVEGETDVTNVQSFFPSFFTLTLTWVVCVCVFVVLFLTFFIILCVTVILSQCMRKTYIHKKKKHLHIQRHSLSILKRPFWNCCSTNIQPGSRSRSKKMRKQQKKRAKKNSNKRTKSVIVFICLQNFQWISCFYMSICLFCRSTTTSGSMACKWRTCRRSIRTQYGRCNWKSTALASRSTFRSKCDIHVSSRKYNSCWTKRK